MYTLYPNDPFPGDSIENDLSTGVLMLVHPNGVYELSFEIDPDHEAPKMQVFRTYSRPGNSSYYDMSKIMTLKPDIVDNRYVYFFVCEEKDISLWAFTLEEGGTYYMGKTENVRFEGDGFYSNHLSLNLVTVGLIDPIEGSISVNSLARLLVQAFRDNYKSFVIDTIYVNHAENHPTLGEKFPPTEYWYAGRSSNDLSVFELGGWPGKGVTEALDIVLVRRIEDLNVLGYAGLFSMSLKGGESSAVMVGTHVLTTAGDRALTANEIVSVAIHETGHFFGLRHTTSTWEDLEGYMDLSILEDGFEDTPYCLELLYSGLYKTAGEAKASTDFYQPYGRSRMLDARAYGVAFDVADCPDAELVMFPVNTPSSKKSFSKKQLQFLQRNLMLIPH